VNLLKILTVITAVIFFGGSAFAAETNSTNPLTLVNAERSSAGLLKLKSDRRLEKAAKAHAQDMAKFNFISHTGSNGSDLRKRLKRAGYKPCYGAENLALATKSWPDTVEKWMESSGHKTNILDKRAASVGFWQVDKRYWVMVVGKKC